MKSFLSVWNSVSPANGLELGSKNQVGNEAFPAISAPQINNTIVFSIYPGAYAQMLHRDDPVLHNFQPDASTHSLGRDTAIGLFITGTKSTRRNGATRFIPGSHLWDYSLPHTSER